MSDKKALSFDARINLSKMMQYGLIDQVEGSAIGQTDLCELVARELPNWLTGPNVSKSFEGIEEYDTFLILLEGLIAQCDGLWKYDQKRYEGNGELFYTALTHHASFADSWDLNVWFLIRTLQSSARAVERNYRTFIDGEGNAENTRYLAQLDSIIKLRKSADALYNLATKAFDAMYDRPAQEETATQEAEA